MVSRYEIVVHCAIKYEFLMIAVSIKTTLGIPTFKNSEQSSAFLFWGMHVGTERHISDGV